MLRPRLLSRRPLRARSFLSACVTIALIVVTRAPSAQALHLIAPNGGEHLNSLQPFDIKWDTTATTRVEYKVGFGAPVFIANAAGGHLTWDVPEISSKQVKII